MEPVYKLFEWIKLGCNFIIFRMEAMALKKIAPMHRKSLDIITKQIHLTNKPLGTELTN